MNLTKTYSASLSNLLGPADFHAACDGNGRTFTVADVQIIGGDGTHYIVGGYNPVSWDSTTYYRYTTDRSAFIFNLTTLTMLNQTGECQTLNNSNFGPCFGEGNDLNIYQPSTGEIMYQNYALLYSYDPDSTDTNIFGTGFTEFTVNTIEVFTIAIPEPASLSLLALGGLALTRRRRK